MHLSAKSTASVWKRTVAEADFPRLKKEIAADVTIVGAGITGLTTALLLQESGYKVVVLDSGRVGGSVTGFTSGHLTSLLLDMEYKTVQNHFGEEATRKVARSVEQAIDFIEKTVLLHEIDCDFKRLKGYLFAEKSNDEVADLIQEYHVCESLELPVGLTHHVPLPFRVEEAMVIANQARFHPLKYLQGLAAKFVEKGGQIFEFSKVSDIHQDGVFTIATTEGGVTSREVVLATHTPIGFRPAIQTRLNPIRSYIIGVRISNPVEDALYWDMDDPYHYIRIAEDENGPLLIIGGEDHRTGEREDTETCFENLEIYAHERFEVTSVDYRWSAQLYDPADGLPYIGKLSGVYVATGFTGEGLTFGTVAAQLIADQIRGIDNELGAIYAPTRTKPIASAAGFLKDNVATMAHFVKDRITPPQTERLEDIPFGEGALAEVSGRKLAVYRDHDGTLHVMSPVCTHMGCIVDWNPVESSWDCPCHGGRFDCKGNVINGPPTQDLETIDIRPL